MNEELNYGIEVTLDEPDSFLLIKESLTRIGVASNKSKTLYQSCHLLHKRGKYYIVHFKELFRLDGRHADISEDDIKRRNLIAFLLSDWGLLKINNPDKYSEKAQMSSIKVLSFKDKQQWALEAKYTLGKKGYSNELRS